MQHALSGIVRKMMLLVVGLAIMPTKTTIASAIEYRAPQCLQPKVENFNLAVCKNIQTMKSLNDVVRKDWKNLKIVNENGEQFEIDDEIHEKFTYLEELDLSQAGKLNLNINGFKELPELSSLNITNCQLVELKGTHFGVYNKLTYLDASWNLLEELTFDLKSKILYLQVANFSHNAIKVIDNDSFKIFQKLKYLHLDHNELKSVTLQNYPQLEVVTMSGNQIEILTSKSFSFLESMEELTITLNPLYYIGERTFESMSNLRMLNLSANNMEQLSSEVFYGLGRLLHLDLSFNNLKDLTNSQFKYLFKLQFLDLSRNSLTMLNSTHFEGLSNLRKLYIYENDIIELKSNTFANLVSLDTLDLSSNSIEFIEADVFGSVTLSRFRKLTLRNNNIKRLHPLAFTSLPFLQYLSLGNNDLTTLDVRMFAPMRRLEKLHLGNNLLETIPSDVLDSITDVSELLLDNNRLTFLSPTNATFSRLVKASIEGNPWQCPCHEEITKWLEARKISYVRTRSPFYKGQKPLCVVTAVDFCVKDLKIAREHDIEDIYNSEYDYESSA